MVIGAIIVIGAIVGGVVGGIVSPKSTTRKSPSNEAGPPTVTLSGWTGFASVPNAPAGSSQPPAGTGTSVNLALPP